MTQSQVLVRRSTNTITVSAIRDRTTGQYVDPSVTVATATLLDVLGVPVAGAIDVPLAWVPGTTGPRATWRGDLPYGLVLNAVAYTLRVTAIVDDSVQREFNLPVTVIDG